MLEVEIKAFLDGLSSEKIAAAAKELGFRKCGVLQETDIYINGNDRNFMKTDEALRIRSCGEQGEDGVFCREETFITYRVLQETDIYINGNDRNFMKTDEALRIRSCGEQGEDGVFCREETFITYKGRQIYILTEMTVTL